MVKNSLFALLAVLVMTVHLHGAQPPGTLQLGGRLGLFNNAEDRLAVETDDVRLRFNKNSIYAEACLNYYVLPPVALVANLGAYSKGDIKFEGYQELIGYRTFFGSANVYPLQLGVKLSPFSTQLPVAAMPYLEVGGALMLGSESIDALYYDQFRNAWVDGNLETETDWNWWLGGGVEVPLSPKMCLDFMVKYINVEFDGDLAGITDYSGWQITVGFGYLIVVR